MKLNLGQYLKELLDKGKNQLEDWQEKVMKFWKKFKKGGRKTKKSSKGGTSTPPDIWWRRWLWYMNPRRFKDFWFTKPGLKAAGKIAGVGAVVGIALVIGAFAYVARDLPSPGQVNSRVLAQTTKFYDRSGEHLLYEVYGNQNRSVVELNKVADVAEHATVAIEDKNFYDQGAFSVTGIIRAAYQNVVNPEALQGGSTITQQYVKNALLSPDRTIVRKIKELILAIQIEQLYSKDQILEFYLNEIPYGSTAYGIEAAAQMYFSKDAKNLTIAESAMLAALPQAPSYYSPYGGNTDALVGRQQHIIDLMQRQGYITEEEAEKAKKVDILKKVNNVPDTLKDIKAPHFVLHVQQLLEQRYSTRKVNEGGLKVITTLDWKKQKIADKAVKSNMDTVVNLGGDNAAFVAENPNNGQVLAMVGSRGFNYKGYGAYNAALAGRQPGSSFKPYVYATLFKQDHWGPGSVMYDVPTAFGASGDYQPSNFDNSYRGFMTVRTALAESRNIPAVKALYMAGVENSIRQARSMGISTLKNPSRYGLSLVLGAGEVKLAEHVHGYSSFANGGVNYPQSYVLKVTDSQGNVLEEWKKSKPERVLDPQIAYLMTSILSDDQARSGTFGYHNPNLYVPNLTYAVKTGTTDQSRDGWMMGYSRHLAAGVWVGNHDNKPMNSITSNQAGPIWTDFMKKAHKGLKDKSFKRPDGIKQVTLDKYTGMLPTNATGNTVTDIFPAWYQPLGESQSESAVVDTVLNKKIPGNLQKCVPTQAQEKRSSVAGVDAEVPPDDPAYPRWNPPVQSLAQDVNAGGGSGSIPEESISSSERPCPLSNELPSITFSAEQNGDEIDLDAQIQSNSNWKLEKLEIKYQGSTIESESINGNSENYSETIDAPSGDCPYSFTLVAVDKGMYQNQATASTDSDDCPSGETTSTDPGPGPGFPFTLADMIPVRLYLLF